MPEENNNTNNIEPTEDQTTNGAGAIPESFDAWLAEQDEGIKTLIDGRFTALENTVKATRSERDEFKSKVKELAKLTEEGSEARKALDDMTAQLQLAERRASFLEEAMKPEVQCRNPRAAWLLAEAEGHFDKNNNPNWAAIKQAAPELFGAVIAKARAGDGTADEPAVHKDMNTFIRRSAGH